MYSAVDREGKEGLHGRSLEGVSKMRQDFDGSLVVRAAGVSWTQAGADTCPVRDLNMEAVSTNSWKQWGPRNLGPGSQQTGACEAWSSLPGEHRPPLHMQLEIRGLGRRPYSPRLKATDLGTHLS